ncbi:hypothetical protein [Glaciihabitans sp. dw_435]|uniref:hypothetical protein n=1 Tax=Glaciihabitans sp. dw_435 TaxID=2720081 RepID=UPI001BD20A8F|nr:hypothetical protein [Glaciihabitans sp. dw_435]
MASSYDFFITGDHEAAKALVASSLTEQGYSIASTPAGGFVISRGSVAGTVLWGAMAGKKFHMRFDVEFFADDQGRTVARLNRGLASGMLKGGAIGASKTANGFQNIAHELGKTLTGAGVLASTLEN